MSLHLQRPRSILIAVRIVDVAVSVVVLVVDLVVIADARPNEVAPVAAGHGGNVTLALRVLEVPAVGLHFARNRRSARLEALGGFVEVGGGVGAKDEANGTEWVSKS